MADIAKSLAGAVTSVSTQVKTRSRSAVNIFICLVTVGSEQLFTFAVFTCPCPIENTTSSAGLDVNELYGGVFILVPAVALFSLGFAMNLRTWKMMTGCCRRDSDAARGYLAGSLTLLEVLLQALVAPCAWVAIAFLDGRYYACARTHNPYDMPCDDVIHATKSTKIRFTVEYERNKQKSQIVGWVFIAATFFVGSVVFMMYRWCSGLTYHHRLYMKWYREIESEKFEEMARKELKAQAEANIEHFLREKRGKSDWDKISTVFNFTRDDRGYALYSRLDQWCEDDDNEVLRHKEEQLANGALSDSEEKPLLSKTTMTSQSGDVKMELLGGDKERLLRVDDVDAKPSIRQTEC